MPERHVTFEAGLLCGTASLQHVWSAEEIWRAFEARLKYVWSTFEACLTSICNTIQAQCLRLTQVWGPNGCALCIEVRLRLVRGRCEVRLKHVWSAFEAWLDMYEAQARHVCSPFEARYFWDASRSRHVTSKARHAWSALNHHCGTFAERLRHVCARLRNISGRSRLRHIWGTSRVNHLQGALEGRHVWSTSAAFDRSNFKHQFRYSSININSLASNKIRTSLKFNIT